jgi:hypothetical protein
MTEEKHLDPAIADKIGDYVKLKGNCNISVGYKFTDISVYYVN